MFTGIIQQARPVISVNQQPGLITFAVDFDKQLLHKLKIGASVAVDGVCLTVTKINDNAVSFDAMRETLNKTTLNSLRVGQRVNVERSASFDQEIGGHRVSGHVQAQAQIIQIKQTKNNYVLFFQCPKQWIKYIFPKGFIALNGASLTVVDLNRSTATFSVHLIPETLKITTFGEIQKGDLVNLEIDTQTQTIVDTVERILATKRAGTKF